MKKKAGARGGRRKEEPLPSAIFLGNFLSCWDHVCGI
jgi:hypothetical protein